MLALMIIIVAILGVLFYRLKEDDPLIWGLWKNNENFRKLWNFPDKLNPEEKDG
jgi:hypothetical protein